MLHIDPAVLRKYPILGVLIGGATAIILTSLILSGWTEASALIGQKAPKLLSLREAMSIRGIRWITVSEGQWHCDRAITIDRPAGLERWVRGPVEATEVPISGGNGELLIACFDGSAACPRPAGWRLTGVVGSTEIFTSRGALRRWGGRERGVTILAVGASPRYAQIMLIGLITIALGGLLFAGYYLTLMLRPGGRESMPVASCEPIQPD